MARIDELAGWVYELSDDEETDAKVIDKYFDLYCALLAVTEHIRGNISYPDSLGEDPELAGLFLDGVD